MTFKAKAQNIKSISCLEVYAKLIKMQSLVKNHLAVNSGEFELTDQSVIHLMLELLLR